MPRAEITFALPTTRVNSANLAESEISHVDVYDNRFGDTRPRRETQDAQTDSPEVADPTLQGSEPRGDSDGLEKQSGSAQRRRKIGEWKSEKAGVTPRFETDELEPGVHYFQLVAVDTDGRAASPSAAFRLNVNVEGDTSAPKDNDEPALARNVTTTGSDDDRPSLITKVQVKLL